MNLSPEQWERVESLFEEALGRPAAEREAFAARAAADDDAVRAELLALIEAEATAGDFLSTPVDVDVPGGAPAASLAAGQRLGAWRIVEMLGGGGMGEVYRAERADGAFELAAALKVLRRGLDTEAVLRRTMRERRILAQLRHPGVVRLLDAGATEDGRPWLVMDLVEGQPIDAWCEARGASVPQILGLMATVCDVVHEAHRQLVVHRDLKPSNVLVDAEGAVRLLDFGIAGLMESDGTDVAPELTVAGSRPHTPEYAAPEQLAGEATGTPADVFALGGMLFRLLSGRPPRERVRFAAPGRDGTGTPTLTAAVRDSTTFADERARAKRLKEVAGDLEWIVGQAMRSEPERRYRSAAELADDLRRTLDGRPVVARPESLGYVFGRFLRRNRVSAAFAAAALVALVAGLGMALWQAHEARLAAERADAERVRAERVRDFIVSVFREQDPFSRSGDEARTPKDLIGQAAARLDDELAGEPALRAELRDDLGQIQSNLGDIDTAARMVEQALEERRRQFGEHSSEFAESQQSLARIRSRQGLRNEAEQLARASLSTYRALGLGDTVDAARSRRQLAIAIAYGMGAPDEALKLEVEAQRIFEANLGIDSTEAIETLYQRGQMFEQTRQDAEAEPLLREAMRRLERSRGDRSVHLWRPLFVLGVIAKRDGRFGESEALYQRAIALLRQHFGEKHDDLANCLVRLADLYGDMGRWDDADTAYRQAEAALAPGRDDQRQSLLLNRGQMLLHRPGREADAERDLAEAYALKRKLVGDGNAYTWFTAAEWGRSLASLHRYAEAEKIQRQALERIGALLGADAYQNAIVEDGLATTLEFANRTNEATTVRRDALRTTELRYPRTHRLWAKRAFMLAVDLAEGSTADRAEALALAQASAEVLTVDPDDLEGNLSILLTGRLRKMAGDRSGAQRDLQKALERLEAQADPDAEAIAEARRLLDGLRAR